MKKINRLSSSLDLVRRRQGFFVIPAVHSYPLVKGGIGDAQFGAPVFDFPANRHFIFSQMKKAAVNIIVVTNDTSIASFVPASAMQDGTAYAKYFRFSIFFLLSCQRRSKV